MAVTKREAWEPTVVKSKEAVHASPTSSDHNAEPVQKAATAQAATTNMAATSRAAMEPAVTKSQEAVFENLTLPDRWA